MTNNRAQAKVHPASRSKSVSPSKPKASSTAKPKTAALKPVKSAKKAVVPKKTVVKKDAAKLTKSVVKKNVAAKKVTKRMASTSKAAVKQVNAPAKTTKVKAKAPLKAAVIAKPVARKSPIKASTSKLPTKQPAKTVVPIRVVPPPPPEPPRKLNPTGAMRAFEHAVRVFNRRMFEDAKTMFEHLLEKFPREVEIAARTQMYLQVCNQKLAHTTSIPRNADDLYDQGVYALNLGDFSQAKTFFEKALRMKPDEPHLLYSLAATHAQTGSHDQALDYLKRTIQLQPRYRTQALNDSDFTELRENKQFLELLGLASPFDLLQSRR
ncbi:MAG: tetratricopeptide repeat protein [Acidobacteria bacterium]|nr:tetratricopeptide repeat protein [Acidobacteriota bacterium]